MVTGLDQEKKLLQPVGPAARPHISGKKGSRIAAVPGIPALGTHIPPRSGLQLPFPASSSPGAKGKRGKKICASLSHARCQQSSPAGIEQRGDEPAASPQPSHHCPHPAHSTELPAAPPSPPKWTPGNKIPLCSCPEDSPAPGRVWPGRSTGLLPPHQGPSSLCPAHSRGMFPLSSL